MKIRELYCKLPTDLDYEAKVESSDEAFNILQQIKKNFLWDFISTQHLTVLIKKFYN